MEVCTWTGAVSPQSRTTRGQAKLLPWESQSWVTHPAPFELRPTPALSLSAVPRDYFSYLQKANRPLDSVAMSLEGGPETV